MGLVGIQDSQRGRHRVVCLGQVMVGNDQVQTQPLRSFRFGERSHAGINRDDQTNAFGVCCFQHAGLQPVALMQAVRNMKPRLAAQHFDGGLQQHDRSGAVHIVVSVEQHGLFGGNRARAFRRQSSYRA